PGRKRQPSPPLDPRWCWLALFVGALFAAMSVARRYKHQTRGAAGPRCMRNNLQAFHTRAPLGGSAVLRHRQDESDPFLLHHLRLMDAQLTSANFLKRLQSHRIGALVEGKCAR